MKNKIVAICIVLVLTVATGLVTASDHIYIDREVIDDAIVHETVDLDEPLFADIELEQLRLAIEDVRNVPFEKKGSNNGELPPLPNPFMVTYLSEEWNMIGYPNQGTVDLTDLAVIYNDTIYTWTEAWEQQIILRFVYGWNTESQFYEFVEEIEGGKGYWMWSYFDCELWSLY